MSFIVSFECPGTAARHTTHLPLCLGNQPRLLEMQQIALLNDETLVAQRVERSLLYSKIYLRFQI